MSPRSLHHSGFLLLGCRDATLGGGESGVDTAVRLNKTGPHYEVVSGLEAVWPDAKPIRCNW